MRPRFWYVVAANCQTPITVQSWSIMFENPFHSQFGVNNYGLNSMYIVFTVMYFVMGCIHSMAHKEWNPVIVRVFTIAMWVRFLGCMCLAIHWGVYGDNGVGTTGLEGFGRLLDWSSSFLIWIYMALFSMGFGITSHAFPSLAQNVVPFCIMGTFGICYIAFFLWYEFGRDRASTNYAYDSAAGVCIVLTQCAYFVWWLLRTRTLIRRTMNEKARNFLRYTSFVNIAWFAVLPVVVMLGAVTSPWWTNRVLYCLNLVLTSCITAFLVHMWWPSRARPLFEYGVSGVGADGVDENPATEAFLGHGL